MRLVQQSKQQGTVLWQGGKGHFTCPQRGHGNQRQFFLALSTAASSEQGQGSFATQTATVRQPQGHIREKVSKHGVV